MLGLVLALALIPVAVAWFEPIHYWPFDEGGLGEGRDAQNLEGLSTPSSVGGLLDNATNLTNNDGDSWRLENLFLNSSKVRTIDFWFNSSNFVSDDYMFDFNSNTGSGGDRFFCSTSSGNLFCEMRVPAAVFDFNVPSLHNTDEWVHIVILLGTGGADLYVNGSLVVDGSSTQTINANMTYIEIGDAAQGGLQFDGAIDNFAMFEERYTTTNITAAFNNGVPLDYSIVVPSVVFLNASLSIPANNANIVTSNQTFSYITNLSGALYETAQLFHNGTGSFIAEAVNTTTLANGTNTFFDDGFVNGTIVWGVFINTTTGESFRTENFTFTVSITPPINETLFNQVCPATIAGQMSLWIIIFIALFLILIGLMFSSRVLGGMGAIILLVSSFVLTGCLAFAGMSIALVSIFIMMKFFFIGSSKEAETFV